MQDSAAAHEVDTAVRRDGKMAKYTKKRERQDADGERARARGGGEKEGRRVEWRQ
jgi:hypothetical protein